MSNSRIAEAKPLSFSTTMRNPMRIADFLMCLVPYEGKILTHDIIMEIIKRAIKFRVYNPNYIRRKSDLKDVFADLDKEYTDEQINEIIENSPQQHKEAGFDWGWDSRFDTIFKLPMEFGYIFYQMDKPILISKTGHIKYE